MSKSATVQARMKPELKRQADAILEKLGINASTAISLYYSQIIRHRGIPLELKVPNEGTRGAIRELKDPAYRRKAKKFTSVRALMDDLKS
ncbi:MAG: type II toxin-antitoxin system RelB/DinJ family antitoxin [Rhizobiales bacterium]|nr:type II toxin-antitoxin system RelB/DinJ family antitoxin [Hyphomicrobiales bacterium]